MQLGEEFVRIAQHGGEPLALEADHLWVGGRVERQAVLPVEQAELAACGVELQLQLAAVEYGAVVVAEQRQQHLALELGIERVPVDVEGVAVRGGRAVFQHVEPPAVVGAHHAHVVGHDVEDLPHAMRVQRCDEVLVIFRRADLGIERGMVDDVVAVAAARPRLEIGRGIDVADAEVSEVGHEVGGLREA